MVGNGSQGGVRPGLGVTMDVTCARRVVALVGLSALVAAGCDLGSPPVTYRAPSRVVETADVNGDGSLDVVSAGSGAYAVLLNDGRGRLRGSAVATGLDVVAFGLGDVDGDGAMDRVDLHRTPDGGGAALSLLRGDGDGRFRSPESLGSTTARELELADMDGDGDLDVITAGPGPDRFTELRRNDGAGRFAAPVPGSFGRCGSPGAGWVAALSGHDLAAADVDGDGDKDVVTAAVCEREGLPSPYLHVGFNEGNGDMPSSQAVGLLARRADSVAGLAVGDVDEDGELDALVGHADEAGLTLVGLRTLDHVTVPVPDVPGELELADVDGDGHLDVVATAAGRGRATILYGDGSGAFPRSRTVRTGGTVVDDVTAGRIDGDGSTDLVFGNDSTSRKPKVAVLANTDSVTLR